MLNHETQTAFEIIIKDKKLILEWIKDALMFRCEDCARVWLSVTRLRPKYNNNVPLKTDWYYLAKYIIDTYRELIEKSK